MSEIHISPEDKEMAFNQWLVAEYLKYGSVDEVYRVHHYNIPVSYPSYQRVLNKWGIVKAAGPNSKLAEAVEFLSRMAKDEIPLESLYRKMPPSFSTSVSTMHRILHHVKEGITRRVGTALVITPYNDPDMILVGNDVATPRLEYGKPYGSISLPMGFSRKRDARRTNVMRVLQQEVFTNQTIDRQFPDNVLTHEAAPFMYIDIADVQVSAYHLSLGKELSGEGNFSSFKLQNHRYVHVSELESNFAARDFRTGIQEIAIGYANYLNETQNNIEFNPYYLRSRLNRELALLPAED